MKEERMVSRVAYSLGLSRVIGYLWNLRSVGVMKGEKKEKEEIILLRPKADKAESVLGLVTYVSIDLSSLS